MMTNGWKPKGILNPNIGETKFQLTRHAPASDLTFFIERYWIIQWDLRGQPPYQTETLPQPYVNLVVEQANSRIYGVASGKYTNLLQDKGRVFGVKFKPGAFYPFVKSPISQLTDRSIPLEDVFGAGSKAREAAILAQTDENKMIALADDFLRTRLPDPDETVTLTSQIVDCIMADRTITRVDDVAQRFNLSKRTLQHIFSQYVGVSPKWVIQRYRLHEAAEQLANGAEVNLPALALDLGYFDQAHFSKDFKALVGVSPVQYAKLVGVSV